jgi:hypothetical protein
MNSLNTLVLAVAFLHYNFGVDYVRKMRNFRKMGHRGQIGKESRENIIISLDGAYFQLELW